ncbi:sensor histidine kinase [Streptosporangium sp. NBC_01495]|uniref:sensor histidine kinase n=1 Tax=Streptosporangium sp. NBC_01495 TaxID=2903899 RepID=UPI002E308C27|nr:sensor histidine kinase [Streptosporangium sp. NBC_01495]
MDLTTSPPPEERFARNLKPPVATGLLLMDIAAAGVLSVLLLVQLFSLEETLGVELLERFFSLEETPGAEIGAGAATLTSWVHDPAVRVVMGILATVPLMARRITPRLSSALVLVGAAGLLVGGIGPGDMPVAAYVAGLLCFYTIVRQLDHGTAWIVGGSTTLLLLASGWYAGAGTVSPFVLLGAALVGSLTLLSNLHLSRTELVEIRADNLERVGEQATTAERARIAREMHDIVAHSVSMIAVQAETAPYTLKNLDDQARQEFADIAASARGTLTEMRRLLGVLRADVTAAPETAPQPGLARLPELVEWHDGEVDLDVIGEKVPVPQAVEVSAYRIVQEALTNARVHAPGARVSIELTYRPALLVLRIADDGPGPSGDTPGGHGLVGMRERALSVGGWFGAGPGPNGGFLVRAGLPLR